jgi:hypothetical protein
MPASLRSDGVRDYPGMPFGFPSERAFSFAGIPNNNRKDMNDSDRFVEVMKQAVGKRLTYAE